MRWMGSILILIAAAGVVGWVWRSVPKGVERRIADAPLVSQPEEQGTAPRVDPAQRAPLPATSEPSVEASADDPASDHGKKPVVGFDPFGPSPYPLVTAEQGVPIHPSRWMTMGAWQRTPVPDEVFDAKYPPETPIRFMEGVARELDHDLHQQVLSLTREQFAQGDFEEVELPLDTTLGGHPAKRPHFYLGLEDPDWQIPRYSTVYVTGKPNKIAWVRFADHPDFYDLDDELNYLRRRVQVPVRGTGQ